MNKVLRCYDIQKTAHAGSTSVNFDKFAFNDISVNAIPLYGWKGDDKKWWRLAHEYDATFSKDRCSTAGPLQAGGQSITTDSTPFCTIVMHFASSRLKGDRLDPTTGHGRRFAREAPNDVKSRCVKKCLALMWSRYEAGCPNVKLLNDSHLNETQLTNCIAVWRAANPKCLLTPMYTRSSIRAGDKDYIIFFHETGAAGGYFGGEWHKSRGDGHFPVLLNTSVSFPVRQRFGYQIYHQGVADSSTRGGYYNYENSYEASRQVDDERFLKMVPEETIERNVAGDDQTFVGVAPAPPGLLAAASASSEQRSEAPAVAPMRNPAPNPTGIAAAGPSQAGSSNSTATLKASWDELTEDCSRGALQLRVQMQINSVRMGSAYSDLDCAKVAADNAKRDSETKKVADDLGLDPDVITGQGMLETQRGLGRFGGRYAILLPFSGGAIETGGGIDPAGLVEDGIDPEILDDCARRNALVDEARVAVEEFEAHMERRHNPFRVFNQEISTFF